MPPVFDSRLRELVWKVCDDQNTVFFNMRGEDGQALRPLIDRKRNVRLWRDRYARPLERCAPICAPTLTCARIKLT